MAVQTTTLGKLAEQVQEANLREKDAELQETKVKLQEAQVTIKDLQKEVAEKDRKLEQSVLTNIKSVLLNDPDATLHWKECSPVPEVLLEGSAVVIGDHIYVGGGKCERKLLGISDNECTVFAYEYKRDVWDKLPLPQSRRHRFALVAFQDRLVLIGGSNPDVKSGYLNTLIEWDNKNRTWTEPYPAMNTSRKLSTATGYDEYIAVAGGETLAENKVDIVEVFDGNSKQWHFVAPLPVKVRYATSVVFDGNWYIMGGEGQGKEVYHAPFDTLAKSTTDAKPWKKLCDTHHYFSTITAFDSSLMAIGGLSVLPSGGLAALLWQEGAVNGVYIYFPVRKAWVPVENPLPLALYSSAIVVVPTGELLVIGGQTVTGRYECVYKGTFKRNY